MEQMFEKRQANNRAIKPTRQTVTQNNKANIQVDVYINQSNKIEGWNCGSELQTMLRCRMLILATQSHFPRVRLKYGKVIAPDPISWSQFTVNCSDDECEECIYKLNMASHEPHHAQQLPYCNLIKRKEQT